VWDVDEFFEKTKAKRAIKVQKKKYYIYSGKRFKSASFNIQKSWGRYLPFKINLIKNSLLIKMSKKNSYLDIYPEPDA
jgi:hypothetical protein